MSTGKTALEPWPKLIVVATGSPSNPARYFAIYTAATVTILLAAFALYQAGLPPLFAFALTALLLLAKTKAMHRMYPQHISAQSGPGGSVLIQGNFSERTIPRNRASSLKTAVINADDSLSIALADDSSSITLDTTCFRPGQLRTLGQLINAMLDGDASATEAVAGLHGLKSHGRNGNKAYFLMEKPNVAGLTLGASALSILLVFGFIRTLS